MAKEKPIRYRSRDLSTTVALAGSMVAYDNVNRVWLSFVNEGPNLIDIYFIARDGKTVMGKLRLAQYGSLTINRNQPWTGPISATAHTAPTVLCGVEVELEP